MCCCSVRDISVVTCDSIVVANSVGLINQTVSSPSASAPPWAYTTTLVLTVTCEPGYFSDATSVETVCQANSLWSVVPTCSGERLDQLYGRSCGIFAFLIKRSFVFVDF